MAILYIPYNALNTQFTSLQDGRLTEPAFGFLRELTNAVNGIPITNDHSELIHLDADDHLQYHSDARALVWLLTRSTSDLPEGSNLYFTNERVDDRIADLLVEGAGIDLTYDDAAGSLTIASTITQYTNEMAQDAVGSILTDSATVDFTYDDAANTITAIVKLLSINTGHIIDSAVTNIKIATGIDAAKLADGSVSNTEFQYINTVTSNVQTQLDGKQVAGNYITALTGDGTAAGPGSSAFTLATVNANVGSFGSATQVSAFTVNAKGLITAASNTSIQIAESQVTNLVTDLAAKQPLDATLTALAAFNTNGLLTQTAADTFTGRTITVASAALTISNGDGVAANPALGLNLANANTWTALQTHQLTTEQLRLGYDGSNYLSFTTGSTGTTRLTPVGTTPLLALDKRTYLGISSPMSTVTGNFESAGDSATAALLSRVSSASARRHYKLCTVVAGVETEVGHIGTTGTNLNFGTNAVVAFSIDVNQDFTFTDASDLTFGSTTGTKIGTATTQKIGFWNQTPVIRPSAYTPTNVTTDRSYDANSTTLDEIADVVGTLIADLQSMGLIG